MSTSMGTTVLGVVLGAIVSIVLTILIEGSRKPKLSLRISEPTDITYENRPASSARFLGLELVNRPLPKILRWLQRNAALQCHGTIEFYHLDGQNVFGRAMPIRWSGSPEPVPMRIAVDGARTIVLVYPARFTLSPRIDVYPGERERLDVAAKFDEESECYGWSNESYISNPVWRNPNWRLPAGRYLVKVVVISSGERISGLFRLINDVSQQDFRLEPPLPGDKVY